MESPIALELTKEQLSFLPSKGDHPMMDIPFMVGIDGRQYRGMRLSLVMAEIGGLMDPSLENATRLMRLVFPFHGFSVTLGVLGLIQHVDRDKGLASVTFVDPGGEHLPQMRHILNSYIAGDLVALGGVIGVGSTLPSPAKRAANAMATRKLTLPRVLGTAGMVLATALLLGGASTLAYSRIFTQPIATPGRAMQDGMTLGAIAAGQLDYVNLEAGEGEVAFSIRTITGDLLSIAMPCTCTATLQGTAVGATVQSGDAVMTVSQPDAPLVVTTQVTSDELLQLAFADHVNIRFANGETIRARAETESLRGQSGDALIPVRLIPEVALPASRAGQLGELTIIHPLPFNLGTAPNSAPTSGN
jgi:mannuronan synthase